MSCLVLDSTTPVKSLKRVARELKIESSGFEKTELVQVLKRARMSKNGFDWSLNPSEMTVTCKTEFEPLPHDDRIYALREHFINMCHEPVLGKKLLAASKNEYLSDEEWAEKREQSETCLTDETHGDFYQKRAEALGNAKPKNVTVGRDVSLIEDCLALPLGAEVLRIGSGSKLHIQFGESVETLVSKANDHTVNVSTFLDLIEAVLFREALRLHADGEEPDSSHPFVEMYLHGECTNETTVTIHLRS